ncbi:MAG: CHASE2 domain-containing protein, partial [Bdellovibrionales bacterium]|nr:CHASE2 domain-containing protein [Bdellovibrionales bacterium]
MIQKMELWLKSRRFQWAIQVSLALAITLILGQFQFYGFEFLTSDLRMKWTPMPESSNNILLVPISEDTVKRMEGLPRLDQFNKMLERIALSQPHSIITFVNPLKLEGTQSDLQQLANLSRQTRIIIGENDLPPTGLSEFLPLSEPFENIKRLPAPKTADRTVLAKDGVTRRALISVDKAPTLYPQIAADFRREKEAPILGMFDFLDSEQ